MPSQVGNGKSFEWAIARSLSELLEIPIDLDDSAIVAESKFNEASPELQSRHMKAADIAILHILSKESASLAKGNPRSVSISSDREGQTGDVRDVVVKGDGDLLGISCKNNHRAFKHSRLSQSIDFAKKWGISEIGVSEEYRQDIAPVFDHLKELREESHATAEWRNIKNKQAEVYEPILSAFEKELRLVTTATRNSESKICRAFIDYIVGNHDFYKVICEKGMVEILGFNFHGTLSVQKSKYPTEIHSIERDTKKRSTSVLRFQEGHTFGFRLHSASTLVEPSLKFDIQALSLPSSQIYTNHLEF